MTPEELNRPGAKLLGLLLVKASSQGISVPQLAEDVIGVSYAYFAGLRNGKHDIRKLGDKHFDQISEFLELSKVAVLLAADKLKEEDFYQKPELLRTQVLPALQFIQSDPEISPYFSPAVFSADSSIQRLLVLLYEKATGHVLIRSKNTIEEISERHKQLTEGGENK